ncbi:hypothetical protein MIR68_008862 [Amoeboaphelidium protococcarum]|nr:hypothetical protein MIR68_008862 [Amoeboaphelidium protococcarum]
MANLNRNNSVQCEEFIRDFVASRESQILDIVGQWQQRSQSSIIDDPSNLTLIISNLHDKFGHYATDQRDRVYVKEMTTSQHPDIQDGSAFYRACGNWHVDFNAVLGKDGDVGDIKDDDQVVDYVSLRQKQQEDWACGCLRDGLLVLDSVKDLMGDERKKAKESSIKYFKQAIELQPHNMYAKIVFGNTLNGVSRYDDAIVQFEQVLHSMLHDNVDRIQRLDANSVGSITQSLQQGADKMQSDDSNMDEDQFYNVHNVYEFYNKSVQGSQRKEAYMETAKYKDLKQKYQEYAKLHPIRQFVRKPPPQQRQSNQQPRRYDSNGHLRQDLDVREDRGRHQGSPPQNNYYRDAHYRDSRQYYDDYYRYPEDYQRSGYQHPRDAYESQYRSYEDHHYGQTASQQYHQQQRVEDDRQVDRVRGRPTESQSKHRGGEQPRGESRSRISYDEVADKQPPPYPQQPPHEDQRPPPHQQQASGSRYDPTEDMANFQHRPRRQSNGYQYSRPHGKYRDYYQSQHSSSSSYNQYNRDRR